VTPSSAFTSKGSEIEAGSERGLEIGGFEIEDPGACASKRAA